VANTVVLIATGVNGDGRREVLGLQTATSGSSPWKWCNY
jgi:putative transposase